MANEYEQLRLKNLEDNRKILAEIGLINPYKKLPKVSFKKAIRGNKRKAEDNIPSRPAKVRVDLDPESSGSLRGTRRRSARIQGKDIPSESELKDEVDQWVDENEAPVKVTPNRPNFYGAVPGVEVGTVWATRVECCRDGVHRPTVAGIHAGQDGAYSIALSGGYEDNVDLGDGFTYTGEGGRDLKGTASNPKNLRTAPQSKDQELTRGNLALSRNTETGNPVRVIRGYKLQQFSPFAPEDGYRYDGLYTVEKFWCTTGQSGFKVWKFALRRCADQPPPPWTFIETDDQSTTSEGTKSDSGFDSDETASQLSSSQSSTTSGSELSSSQSSQSTAEIDKEPSSSQKSSEMESEPGDSQISTKMGTNPRSSQKSTEMESESSGSQTSTEKDSELSTSQSTSERDDTEKKNENENSVEIGENDNGDNRAKTESDSATTENKESVEKEDQKEKDCTEDNSGEITETGETETKSKEEELQQNDCPDRDELKVEQTEIKSDKDDEPSVNNIQEENTKAG